MSRIKRASPALAISILALVAALVVPAIAQVATKSQQATEPAASKSLSKRELRRIRGIARRVGRFQANRQITRRVPGIANNQITNRAPGLEVMNSEQLGGKSLETIVRWAVIEDTSATDDTNAEIVSSSPGVVGLVESGDGMYFVTFNSDVTGCAVQATVGNAHDISGNPNGMVGVNGQNNPEIVGVTRRTALNVLVDAPFTISVLC